MDPVASGGTPPDLELLHRDHDLTATGLLPEAGLAGRLRALLKRLLLPILKRQTDHNAASARLGSQFWAGIDGNRGRIMVLETEVRDLAELPQAFRLLRSDMEVRLDELRREVAALRAEAAGLREQNVASLDAMLVAVKQELSALESMVPPEAPDGAVDAAAAAGAAGSAGPAA